MFRSYKHLELTRHHSFTKFEKVINAQVKQNFSNTEEILAAVFSSALSLLFTHLGDSNSCSPQTWVEYLCYGLIIAIAYIFLFVIFFFGFKFFYHRIKKRRYDSRLHTNDCSPEKCKEIIDDFDVIAFDNLLLGFEFIQQLPPDSDANQELHTYYFHELLYYLKTAITKTELVLDLGANYINSDTVVTGVELYRIYNAKSLMNEIIQVAKNILILQAGNLDFPISMYDEKLYEVMKKQIDKLDERIQMIGSKCCDLLNNIS